MADSETGLCFLWKIENFSMLPHQRGEKLVSQTFAVDMEKKIEFCLWLYPKGVGTVDNIVSALCLVTKDLYLKLNFFIILESTEPSKNISGMVKNHILTNDYILPRISLIKEFYFPQDMLTLRCQICPIDISSEELTSEKQSNPVSNFLRKRCLSRTSILIQKRSIMWPIRNIKEKIERFQNTSIILASALQRSPSLSLTLNFNETSSDACFPILIKQTSLLSKEERLFVKCKITVFSAQKKYQAFKESTHLFQLDLDDVWNFPLFIRADLLTHKKYLYLDDTLLLRCEFAFSSKDGIYHSENNYMPFIFETRQKNKINELSTCIATIYDKGQFCDIELKAGGITIPYYKTVLCARSSVFSAMFEHNMKEKNSHMVEITDVDPDTLKRMLVYLHSDVMEEDLVLEDIYKLYKAADKYNIESLKRQCSILILSDVSVINVCELLALSHTHQDDFLSIAVHDFIFSHGKEIFYSTQWKSFMNDYPKLSGNIMHQVWMREDQLQICFSDN